MIVSQGGPAAHPAQEATVINTLGTTTSIHQFLWDAAEHHFCADISDTNGLGQVWLDSTDEGLHVMGATGAQVTFVVTDVVYDEDEGDLVCWKLASVTGTHEDGRYTMVPFND
jgi:hypothetical protein